MPGLACFNYNLGLLLLQCILVTLPCIDGWCDQWDFPPLIRDHWQSPCTALMAGLSSGLCKERRHKWTGISWPILLLNFLLQLFSWCSQSRLYKHATVWRWTPKQTYHYGDVIMKAMASQITGISTVCSTVCSGVHQRNIKPSRHWPLWGEFTVTGGFPSQMASKEEMTPSDDVIMTSIILPQLLWVIYSFNHPFSITLSTFINWRC